MGSVRQSGLFELHCDPAIQLFTSVLLRAAIAMSLTAAMLRRTLVVCTAIGLSCLPATQARANQWVLGDVQVLWDYGAYEPSLGVLVTLGNPEWGGGSTSNGATICTNRIRLVVGQQGITDALQQRMYSMLLSAHLTQRKALLYVETVGPYCTIQIVTLGSGIQ